MDGGDPLSAGTAEREADTASGSARGATHTPTGAQVPSRTATRPPPAWQAVSAAGDDGTVTLFIVSPQGNKDPLKIRLTDDVSTLRALVTQM